MSGIAFPLRFKGLAANTDRLPWFPAYHSSIAVSPSIDRVAARPWYALWERGKPHAYATVDIQA